MGDELLVSELVAERLEGLRQLHSLGMSLATARVSAAHPSRIGLPISGRVDAHTLTILREGIATWPVAQGDHVLFCDHAPRTFHVGEQFSAVHTATGTSAPLVATLVAATQQWARSWDAIPRRHKAVVVVRGSPELGALLSALPVEGSWTAPRLWLVR